MISTLKNPEVVDNYLQKELSEGYIMEVHVAHPTGLLGLQVSPFGMIPKCHAVNNWHLIVDLSTPTGFSVNDGISKELCSLSYMSVDTIAEQIVSLGKGVMMTKIEVHIVDSSSSM